MLDRELTLDDLKFANVLADVWGTMCSTVSLWGELTTDGHTLTARNLDFPSSPAMIRLQTLIVYRGDDGADWVSVSWPSQIGVHTAMNEAGVCLLMHDANSLQRTFQDRFTPRSLILRAALEAAQPDSYVRDMRAVLVEHRVLVGNNLHASAPITDDEPRAVVFEYDGNKRGRGVTIRQPDQRRGANPNMLVNTNHLRKRRSPQRCERYARLTAGVSVASDESTPFDPAAMIKLARTAIQPTTVHTVCCEPYARRLHVFIPELTDQVVTFELDQWLRRDEAQASDDE